MTYRSVVADTTHYLVENRDCDNGLLNPAFGALHLKQLAASNARQVLERQTTRREAHMLWDIEVYD